MNMCICVLGRNDLNEILKPVVSKVSEVCRVYKKGSFTGTIPFSFF